MGSEVRIRIQSLDKDDFLAYGRVIAPGPDQPPDLTGRGWQCWYPLGELQTDYLQQIGIDRSEPGHRTISLMERHHNREEWVFAIDKPVIQVVSLPGDTTTDRPDPKKTQAFLLLPGQGVLINKGIWHAAGIAPGEDPVLYGFVLGKGSKEDEEIDEGMFPFFDDGVVKIVEN
jgi:ureidoglycolate lyase